MDLPIELSDDDHHPLPAGQTISSSDLEPPYGQAFATEMGLNPGVETSGHQQAEAVGDVSAGSRGTSLQSAREQDEEEIPQPQARLQQLQESPGHSELSRMERGSMAAAYSGTGWAFAVTRAMETPSDNLRDDFSGSALKNMDVDDQELVPDYQSMPRQGATGRERVAEPTGQGGQVGLSGSAAGAASSSGATALVPTEAVGSMVAQLMQPWMEQLMNNQVMLMARIEKMEVARAQSERLSSERASAKLQREEELLSRLAEREQALSAQAEGQLFAHVVGNRSLEVPSSALDWGRPLSFTGNPPALPAQMSRSAAEASNPKGGSGHQQQGSNAEPKRPEGDGLEGLGLDRGPGRQQVTAGQVFTGRAASPFQRVARSSRDVSRTPSPQKRRSPYRTRGYLGSPNQRSLEDAPRSAATEPRRKSVKEFEADLHETRSEPTEQGSLARRALGVQGTGSVAEVTQAREGSVDMVGHSRVRAERVSHHGQSSPVRTRRTPKNPVTPVRPTIVYPMSPGQTEIKPPQSTPPPPR